MFSLTCRLIKMKRIIDALDLLYPPLCVFCADGLEHGSALCEGCCWEMPRIAAPFCEICGESFRGQIDGAFDCPNCTEISFHFEFARAALDRSERALELIHRLKYGKENYIARELGRMACESFSDRRMAVPAAEKWPLMPVPLHWIRMRERQFNQAEEIAKMVGEEMGLPLLNRLKRVRSTKTQTRLSRKQRMENLKGAFSLKKQWFRREDDFSDLPGVILVDDVFTTGSTVDACAKVLRKAGVKRVVVLTVMRG